MQSEVERLLADRVRALRLAEDWTQQSLADRSGVTLASLKRFERTGLISLASLLRLANALGRLDEFAGLFEAVTARSIADLERLHERRTRRRGSH